MASSDEQTTIWAIRFTKRARADMETAEDRLAEFVGEDKAEAWAAGLEDEAGNLAHFPTIWQIAEEDKAVSRERSADAVPSNSKRSCLSCAVCPASKR